MIYIVWIISLIASGFLGYKFRNLTDRVEKVEKAIQKKRDKPPTEPESMVIDELDEVQVAKYEQEKLMKDLNP